MFLAGEPAARSATPDHGLQRFGRNRIVRRWLQGDEARSGEASVPSSMAPRHAAASAPVFRQGSGVDRGNVRVRHLVMRERLRRQSERGKPGADAPREPDRRARSASASGTPPSQDRRRAAG